MYWNSYVEQKANSRKSQFSFTGLRSAGYSMGSFFFVQRFTGYSERWLSYRENFEILNALVH